MKSLMQKHKYRYRITGRYDMKYVTKWLLLVSSILTMTACGAISNKYQTIKGRDAEYQNSQSIPALVVPGGLQGNNLNDDYLVPALRGSAKEYPTLLPPNSI